MRDKNKNIKVTFRDLIRYRKNEMSGKERNALERELQKDPFTEEAAEGFASISAEEISKDINHLQSSLKTRIQKKRRYLVYRIAASVAVLMIISSVFIIVERNKPVQQIAQSNIPATIEIQKKEALKKPDVKDQTIEKPVQEIKKSDKIIEQESKSSAPVLSDEKKEDAVKNEYDARRGTTSNIITAPPVASSRSIKRSLPEAEEKIYSFEDTMPISGVNGPDSPPQPVNGKEYFDRYIAENIRRPDSTAAGQRVVVVVSFLVREDGKIDNLRIIRSPGKQFSDEAIRLIESGPSWKPAQKDGLVVADSVRIRIVFK